MPSGWTIAPQKFSNHSVSRSRFNFSYQPDSERRLHQLRERYKLDKIVASAQTEFEAQVLLRNWARSQFRRSDYQPHMTNFDALTVLDRNLRDHGEEYDPSYHYDPCHFFPLLYIQTLLSVGHEARLMSKEHGMVEVWSNQFDKWVLMDAELNHHLVKDGVPQNMHDLMEACRLDTIESIELIKGEQTSGDANTTMVHLGIQSISARTVSEWFKDSFELVTLRNDWMTNHYLRGHPMRGEQNSIIFLANHAEQPHDLTRALRKVTRSKEELYWPLNHTEIHVTSVGDNWLELSFDTLTPNYMLYELFDNDKSPQSTNGSQYRWNLKQGLNKLSVRSVNSFGIAGVTSHVSLKVSSD